MPNIMGEPVLGDLFKAASASQFPVYAATDSEGFATYVGDNLKEAKDEADAHGGLIYECRLLYRSSRKHKARA